PKPDSAKLCNAVFNVIKRHFKQMELTLPGILPVFFKPGDIEYGRSKLSNYFHPLRSSFFEGMIGIFINPMLKLINGCYPREDGNHSLELLFLRTKKLFLTIKEYLPVVHAEELH